MTSPPEPVTVFCPKCHLIYEDWWRPSVNLTLDPFDARYLEDCSSVTCPRCKTKVSLPAVLIEDSVRNHHYENSKFAWSGLSSMQLGRYAEYFVKMELTLRGLEVYSSEIDDRGIDLVAKSRSGIFYEIQVKSAFKTNYIFFQKEKFAPRPNLLAAIVLMKDCYAPQLFLIPSQEWFTPTAFLVSRDYLGKQSRPEWGISLAKKYRNKLSKYEFECTVASLT